jgi:class 3 adenylate cyclase/CHASE2 domain-containing sensor protein
MKKIGSKYHKNLATLIIILALSGIIIASHQSGILDYAEFKVYDFRINLFAGTSQKSDDIILVLLDQDSIDWAQRERGWGWPWPRQAYAEFVDYMKKGGARSVAFDVLFSEPSIYRNSRQDEIIDGAVKSLEAAQTAIAGGQGRSAGPLFRDVVRGLQNLSAREDDASLARAEEDYGKVVQAVVFSTQTGSVNTWPENLDAPLFQTEGFGPDLARFALSTDEDGVGAQFPIPELRNSAGAIGNVTGQPDSDHIFRRNRLFTIFDGKAVPGLAAASLLAAGYDRTITYDPEKKILRWGEYTIPVDDEGKTLLRYRGPMDSYPCYSMYHILESAEAQAAGREALLPPENFKDSYVFFGYYAQGLFDIFNTPISSVYPGMGAHVTMLDNMLMGDFIQKVPDWITMLAIAAAVILVVIMVLYSGRIPVAIGSLAITLVIIAFAGFWAFYAGWWLPMVAPIVAALTAFLVSTLYSYATEGKDKRYIKNAFSRIISPKVVDILIADPSRLKLGGEKRKMTAIFTDIQRFSSISSELQDQYGEDGPKALVNLLNLYLTEMSDIAIANGGTIDKYEGDAIIAFFGAPVWVENHATLACRSAVLMKRREKELRETIMNPEGEFYEPLKKLIESKVIRLERPLYTRLGINSGDMVVGFMGTPAKMDYTIMGNAVNLAARLEGVNKQYDTKGILISEYTRAEIGDEFLIRPLSRVTVVGIPVPVRLYELLDIQSEASAKMVKIVKAWELAFKAYEGRNFAGAQKVFSEIFKNDPEDTTAKLYADRCEKYIAAPPPESWDGVDNLTEK